jgi:AraC-like DNA-binding protein
MNIFANNTTKTKIEYAVSKAYKQFLLCTILTYSVFSIYFTCIGSSPLNWIDGIIALYHIILLFIPFKTISSKHFTLLISSYVGFTMLATIVIAIIYAKIGEMTAVIWIFLIPIGATTFEVEKNNSLLWIVVSFVCTALVFILTPIFPDNVGIRLSETHEYVGNILTVVFFLVFLSLFTYHRGKITEVRLATAQKEAGKKTMPLKTATEEKTSRDEKIYADILALFEQKKPYCNPDYTLVNLAHSLNTNVRYVSEALQSQSNQNFNNFINTFRIRLVKEMLNSDYGKTYTLQHIYTSAGFQNQSTFNKAFRLLEGLTPSEYIVTIHPRSLTYKT